MGNPTFDLWCTYDVRKILWILDPPLVLSVLFVCKIGQFFNLPLPPLHARAAVICTGVAFRLPAEIAAGRWRFPAANEMRDLYMVPYNT